MKRPWFDPETNMLLLDEYVANQPSFQKIMADAVVTESEVRDQAERTVHLLQKLESLLAPEAHAVATEALVELAVLYAVQQCR